jgi:hypothetical protein
VGIGSAATSANSTLSINTTGSIGYAVSVGLGSGNTGGIYYNNSNSAPTSGYGWGISSCMTNTGNQTDLRALYGTAVSTTASNNGQAFGVSGIAGNSTPGYNFGIFGQLQGTNNGAAVYGHVGTSTINLPSDAQWAGYFDGNAKVTGTLWVNATSYTSDQRLKKNIAAIDSTDKVFLLQPVKYNFKSLQELRDSSVTAKPDTGSVSLANVPEPDYVKKLHYGFLAQDLQKVYPNLVYSTPDSTLGIDYHELIPVIIDQLKKMKQSLADKEARITALESEVQQLQKGKQ